MEEASSTVDILTQGNGDIPSEANRSNHQSSKIKEENFLSRFSQNIHDCIEEFIAKYEKNIQWLIYICLNVGFVSYFAFATKYFLDKNYDYVPFCDDDEYGVLIILFCFVYLLIFHTYAFKPYILPKFSILLEPACKSLIKLFSITYVRWGVSILIVAGILAFLINDSIDSPNRLIAIIGFFLMIILGFIFSKHPGKIKWKPVIYGLIVQFAVGLFTIRWEHGRNMFKCTGDKVATFLKYTQVGSRFVYGTDLIDNSVFAFEALSVIFFMSFMVKILYYYGIIQKVVMSLGWVLQKLLATTICESVNSAANIFLGMTESPILLQPYLQNLTKSEIHAVMASGFASVSGTVLAAYITFGAKPSHLITASVMSAPAALCFSKLVYPETEQSMSTEESIKIPDSNDSSVLDAASKGASQGVEIVMGIIANVIAFVTFIAFLNGIINWFGVLVGQTGWSIEEGLAYVFMPLSFVMGVEWEESRLVGKLIGIKTVINEFAAYKEMGNMLSAHKLSKRSEIIATYAVCGFSNPGSVGIMISTLATLMPGKREVITELVLRAFIAGAMVCFMTACIAGMLTPDDQLR